MGNGCGCSLGLNVSHHSEKPQKIPEINFDQFFFKYLIADLQLLNDDALPRQARRARDQRALPWVGTKAGEQVKAKGLMQRKSGGDRTS